jgi:acyl carrier protein
MADDNQEILNAIIEALGALTQNKVPIDASTVLRQDLNLDSLAEMDLLMALEDKFDVSISLNHLPEIDTVGDLAAMIAMMKKG